MQLNEALFFGFFQVFARCTAMLLASPFYGNGVPVNARIATGMVVSAGLTPVLLPHLASVPEDLFGLLAILFREVIVGIMIGTVLKLLAQAFEMGGSLLDLQTGLSMAQLFDPISGSAASIISRFKYMLAVVLLLCLDAHHLMFSAFLDTYSVPLKLSAESMPQIIENGFLFIGKICLLSLQIAAPVAAVTVIIDAATGLVNKAVPQMQGFLVSLPAKIAVSLMTLGIGLPIAVAAARAGVDNTFVALHQILQGR